MLHLYESAINTFNILCRAIREYLDISRLQEEKIERMRYLLYKRITEEPFEAPLRYDTPDKDA